MADAPEPRDTPSDDTEERDLAAIRERVEAEYDFENFGPADMAKMEREEWEAVFDPESWITGPELLDRVEKDLKHRIATRDVFARVERVDVDGEDRLLAYSDEGYAVVTADGTVEGQGTVLRDVEPTVVLCSMDDYEPPEPPEDFELPSPERVASGSGELGNTMLQIIAVAQILVGIGLFLAWLFLDLQPGPETLIVAPVAAIAFVVVGVFLFLVVANARLSDRFRAEEYRDRLRALDRLEPNSPEFAAALEGDRSDEGSAE
jgi:hypothetical protein